MAEASKSLKLAPKDKMLGYRPERSKYAVKSDAAILGRITKANNIAATVTGIAEQLGAEHMINTNTVDFMVDLFTSKHELGIPASKRYVNFDAKSAKPADIIFRVMGMLMAPLQLQYIAPHGGQKDKGLQDNIEAHINAVSPWLHRKYQTRFDIQNRFWQLLAGRSYLQQSYLPYYWDKTIRRRKDGEALDATDGSEEINRKNSMYNARMDGYKGYAGPPFFVECVDPRIMFPIMTPMGPEGYVKKYKVQRFELDESFERIGKRLEFDAKGEKVVEIHDLNKSRGLELPMQAETTMDNSIEYYEYLDDTFCYYVVGNQVVHKYQHNGGIKVFPSYGLQTGFKEFHLMAMGILWPVRNELPQFDFMRTLWVQKAYLDVFPQLFAQLAENESPLLGDDQNPKVWNIEPSTVKQIRGQLVNALKDAQSGMDFRAAVEMFAGDIDLATIPGLARGVAGAQQPGYAINQLSQSMRTLWKPIIESAELQESSRAEHYVNTVKNVVDEDVTVFGEVEIEEEGRREGRYLTLEPKKIPDFFRIEAKLEPELPIDTQGNMMTWAELHQKGMVTWEDWVRNGIRKTNPARYREKVRRDSVERAYLPKAMEDGMALGRVALTNEIIQARGLDNLNAIGNQDIAALKAARSQQTAPAPPAGGGGGVVTDQTTVPPGAPGMGPNTVPGTAGQTGNAIPPSVGVAGSNPNNAAPGFRG